MTYEMMIKKWNDLIWKLVHKYNVLGMPKEDCYQECLTELWVKFDKYDDDYALSTFIYTVCRNCLLDLNKRATREKRNNIINGNRIPDIKDFDFTILLNKEYIYNDYELDILDICLKELNDNKNKDIIVDILNGFTNEEVGNSNNVSRQYINKIYQDFIKKCIDLVDVYV